MGRQSPPCKDGPWPAKGDVYRGNSVIEFNFYYDIRFWLSFLIVVVLFRCLGFNDGIRKVLLFLSSAFMLLALPRFNLVSFALIFAVSMVTLAAGYSLARDIVLTKPRRVLAAAGAIAGIVLVLAFFKYTWFQELFRGRLYGGSLKPADFIFVIGISYFSFKMMHFVIDCYKKQIKKIEALNFVNYIFFFPAFISGPINRYEQFSEQLRAREGASLKDDLRTGVERVIHGLFKKFVLSTIVYPYIIINVTKSVSEMNSWEIILGLYAYTLYIYFDFAGYSDIAIGSARIMGIELPENFSQPFLKKNIQQLWANWHMSLTRWLTDYIYWPLSKTLRKVEYLKKHPILLSNISIVVTFIICGMWHGESFNFVIWGLYHGVGLALLNIYQKQKRRIRNGMMRSYFSSKYSKWIGIIGTFNFFAFGILFFSFDLEAIKTLFLRVF